MQADFRIQQITHTYLQSMENTASSVSVEAHFCNFSLPAATQGSVRDIKNDLITKQKQSGVKNH